MKRIIDINPNDRSHRRSVIRRLAGIRAAAGYTQAELGELLQVDRSSISRFERTCNPHLLLVQQFARPLGHRVELRTVDLPHGSDEQAAHWRRLAADTNPDRADKATRRATIAELTATRRHLGITQRAHAAAMRADPASVCHIESGALEPWLSTYQRYARALGGRLRVDLVEVPVVCEVKVSLVLAGTFPFSELNRAEKAHLFRHNAARYAAGELSERLGMSGAAVTAWRERVGAAA